MFLEKRFNLLKASLLQLENQSLDLVIYDSSTVLYWVDKVKAVCSTSGFFSLIHIQPMFHFSTPGKCKKIRGFLMFSGGIDVEYWLKIG